MDSFLRVEFIPQDTYHDWQGQRRAYKCFYPPYAYKAGDYFTSSTNMAQ